MKPGASAFSRLDLELQEEVSRFRARLNEPAADALRGLYVSDAEVDAVLTSGDGRAFEGPDWPDLTARLSRLTRAFGLDGAERDVLLICLAPDLNRRYERIYSYLQDDLTRPRPGAELIMRLIDQPGSDMARRLGPFGRLRRNSLLVGGEDDLAGQAAPLPVAMRVDQRVIEYLLGSDELDPRLAAWSRIVDPESSQVHAAVASAEYAAELQWLAGVLAHNHDRSSPGPIVYLRASDSNAGALLALAAANVAGQRVLQVDASECLAGVREPTQPAPFAAIVREALLQEAVLAVHRFDALLDEHTDGRVLLAQLRRSLEAYPHPVLLDGERRWEALTWASGRASSSVSLDPLSAAARARMWSAQLNDACPPEAANELGSRYRLVDDATMRAVVNGAMRSASQRSSRGVELSDLLAVARVACSPPLGGLARHVELRHTWTDLVLPADAGLRLRELCARIRYRATVYESWGFEASGLKGGGVTALFVGPPGTGKSMAAQVIATDLGYDLYRIDLSALVSKYIGETEKNLERIFKAAEQGEAVLLFDEADALFGKRSEVRDAHDRYANVEVAYLLQRLETYDGVAILTSNLSGNVDEAFLRRLDAIVEFPLPDERERRDMWDRCIPAGAPRDADVDLDELSRAFQLAGGHIRNCAVAAAFLAAAEGAPISRRHLHHAVRREYQKLGKLIADPDAQGRL